MINGNANARLQIALLYLGIALLAAASLCIYVGATRIDASVRPKEIELSAGSLELKVGDQAELKVKITPVKATSVGKDEWTTSDKQVATVYPGGIVIANAAGDAEITVARGNLKAVCIVKVRQK